MKTPTPRFRLGALRRSFFAIAALASFLGSPQKASADIPDSRAQISGMYEVARSSDSFFPIAGDREWFLDFGNGTSKGELSGKVAVSLRENPSVKVRIMVWQYYPEERVLVIGNQTDEGSTGAVARAIWAIQAGPSEMYLKRQNQTVVLQPASPNDI